MSSVRRWAPTHVELEAVVNGFSLQLKLERFSHYDGFLAVWVFA